MTDSNKNKNWGIGDLLGRSKDGFQPVNTDERDGLVGDDSDSEVVHLFKNYKIYGIARLLTMNSSL